MTFIKGNEYWKIRSKDGRDRIFKKPEELLEACNEYFKWVEENPLKEQQLFAFQGQVTKEDGNKMRIMSLGGLCNFIDIAKSTFQEYEKLPDFSAITTRVRQIIETQQLEGASAGLLNPSIVARKLGLSEKTVNETHNYNVELTKEEARKISDSLENDF